MKYKNVILVAGVFTALFQMSNLFAATVYGTYSVEANATLLSGQGTSYNGTSWFTASETNWQQFNNGFQPSAAPTTLNDTSVSSYLAAMPTQGTLSLDLGFTSTSAVNGAGSDLVLFFLWDQSANSATATINGVTRELSFQTLYNADGMQQVANNVNWNGSISSNVLVSSSTIDLASFGFAAGAAMNTPLNIRLTANGGNPMALAMVGALHTGTGSAVVPLPVPFILLFTGLVALGFVGRRR